jgi:hypothetical protein
MGEKMVVGDVDLDVNDELYFQWKKMIATLIHIHIKQTICHASSSRIEAIMKQKHSVIHYSLLYFFSFPRGGKICALLDSRRRHTKYSVKESFFVMKPASSQKFIFFNGISKLLGCLVEGLLDVESLAGLTSSSSVDFFL